MYHNSEFLLIGAGLPRTGTKSTKYALEMILPGKCHHMLDARNFQDDWINIYDGKLNDKEFAEYFLSKGYVSAVDAPFSMCYKQALRAFPNAKVLLTVRNPQSWVISIRKTLIEARLIYDTFPYSIFKWFGFGLGYLQFNRIHAQAHKNKNFDEMIQAVETDNGIEYFNKWLDDIKAKVPKEKLLVFNVNEGWEPLCKFLDVPIPEQHFPKVNNTDIFNERIRLKWRRSWLLFYELITLPLLVYGVYVNVQNN